MEKGIDYDYIDITESEENRAEFEQFRKERQEYEEILKNGGRFGIPVVFYNDMLVMGYDVEKLDEFISKCK